MDERQQQIKAGAGLEESRINQDLVDFLQKWGSWFLMALAAAALVYAGLQYLERQRVAKINEAFAAYEGVMGGGNPNPEALRRVADEFEGVRSVAEMCRLNSADIYLESVRTGLRPGAQVGEDGEYPEEEFITDEDREQYLSSAESLYNAVLASAGQTPGRELIALNATFGLAAVYDTRGQVEQAKEQYAKAAELAGAQSLPALQRVARARLESARVREFAPLPAEDDLPALPEFQEPAFDSDAGLAPPMPEDREVVDPGAVEPGAVDQDAPADETDAGEPAPGADAGEGDTDDERP